MKRLFAALLAIGLALSLSAPALAVETPEIDTGMLEPEEGAAFFAVPENGETGLQDQLADIILYVKQILGVEEDYADFYGDYDGNDPANPKWSLNWSDDHRQLSVSVSESRKILNVYRWQDGSGRDTFGGFDPRFPALERTQAEEQAAQWMEKLFTGEETGRVDTVRAYLGADGYYRFYGTVEKNGLESPVTFSLALDGNGLRSFFRSDDYSGYVGELPAKDAAVPVSDGEKGLAELVAAELYYVSDGEGGASLRYVPVGPYTVVDAQSGDVVDMDALYASFGSAPGRGNDAAAMEATAEAEEAIAGYGLSEAELASVEEYSSVMDKKTADEAARKIDALGLEDFSLERCSYSTDSGNGGVIVSLRYAGVMTAEQLYGYSAEQFEQMSAYGDELRIYKYITLDAQTGALRSVSTSYPLWERDEAAQSAPEEREQTAMAFLEQAAPEMADQVQLCTLQGYNEDESLTYAQVHEGYFFPENCFSVTINPASGTVDRFSRQWQEDVTFGGAKDLVSAEEAKNAYIDALDVTLGYVAWPVDLQAEENTVYADYLDWGYTYVEQLRLAYYYSGTDEVLGVDALTGQAVVDKAGETGLYVYEDIDEDARRDMIEALSGAGIGFEGGQFLPEAELTQKDAVTLLLQAAGNAVDPADEDDLRLRAVRQGFLSEEQWKPEAAVTRMDFLRMLLDPSRYGDAARLRGIWDAGFEDVAQSDMAYAALARGLGLAKGKSLEPDAALTRGDGAELLYRFMSR